MTTNELGRLDQRRARRAARAAERTAFAELRAHGLRARHAAKLAHLAAREKKTDETPPPEETTAEVA
ncbi:hypothetical protein [Actinophytocola sp.]|uniref:hypothetical protein n=1 Tax=Actinophytocola sp. TaxID=1872138 RepID=UPI002ED26C6F